MSFASENFVTLAIAGIAVGILSWGFARSRPFGKIGLLAWLQSVSLMLPWLVFFVLFALGVYVNLVGVLVLLGVSTGIYIYLGNRLRTMAKDLPPSAMPSWRSPQQSSSDSNAEGTAAQASSPDALTTLGPVPIPEEDLQTIRGIFGIDTFFATETVPYQEGVIFKGNLRGEPSETHATLSTKLKGLVGDRYALFLVEGPDKRPTVIVLPESVKPAPRTTVQSVLAVVLAIATVLTTFEASGLIQGFDFFAEPARWQECVLIASGLLAVLGVHEIGHQVAARKVGVEFSGPYFLPVIQIGSFGSLNRFLSFIPNRQALCDVAIAGPLAGGALSLLLLLIGLETSHPGSAFQIPAGFFQASALVGTLAKLLLGENLQQSVVDVNPLVVIGWLGLVVTAINALPAGQLDGGRVVQSIYGRRTARITTVLTIGVLVLASFATPLALYWALVVAFLQRDLERPSLEELTEPDDARAALALVLLFLTVATLLPLTPSLAGTLGIGS
ncbi:MAG: site-2 protease family protein [Cyanobacteria bacterium P01_D01_bin.73]